MVELLQALAWTVKVDDAVRARVSSKNEMRDFSCLQFFFANELQP